jgi:hypothetical protein
MPVRGYDRSMQSLLGCGDACLHRVGGDME